MYITNNPEIAEIAENAGVDRIFIDLETVGKEERQHNMDTVKSFHSISDIGDVKAVLTKAELLVRINKIYPGSENEINKVIEQGADVVMLPYFKTVEEVKSFLDIIAGRVKTTLLLETPEAVELLDEILGLDGIDEVHIGLNDLQAFLGFSPGVFHGSRIEEPVNPYAQPSAQRAFDVALKHFILRAVAKACPENRKVNAVRLHLLPIYLFLPSGQVDSLDF